jgi:hypothetical protein
LATNGKAGIKPRLALALVLALSSGEILRAELEGGDYLGGAVIKDVSERERVRILIENARRLEAERARALARQEAEALAERQTLLAMEIANRPPGAILAETHCGKCHLMDQVLEVRHTWLGWTLTLARMRYINGAKISADIATQIRDHLALTQPARGMRPWLEYGMTLLVPLMLGLGLWRKRVGKKPSLTNGS